MKKTKKLWIAQGKNTAAIHLYDKKLSAGESGVYVGDVDITANYPPTGDMHMLRSKELELLGIDIKPGQVIEIKVSYEVPREAGWYWVTLEHSGHNCIREWDGSEWKATRVRDDRDYSRVADKPIPNPFERVPQ